MLSVYTEELRTASGGDSLARRGVGYRFPKLMLSDARLNRYGTDF